MKASWPVILHSQGANDVEGSRSGSCVEGMSDLSCSDSRWHICSNVLLLFSISCMVRLAAASSAWAFERSDSANVALSRSECDSMRVAARSAWHDDRAFSAAKRHFCKSFKRMAGSRMR